MQFSHQPASHAFTTALLRILERTEAMLKRRIEGQDLPAVVEDDGPDTLAGLEVQDSDWVEAGRRSADGQRAVEHQEASNRMQ